MICGRVGIGRRAGLRNRCASVQVQVLSSALNSTYPNLLPCGEGFGFVVFIRGPRREVTSVGVFCDYPNFNSKQDKQNMKNGDQENESEHR